MPIFGNKFSPKKAPLRKNGNQINENKLEELILDDRTILLQLGNQILKFQQGEWLPENGKDASLHKTNLKLRKRINELEEENNLYKVKFEILMNMLTELTEENEKLKN